MRHQKLHKHLMKTSMCVITGLANVTGFDEKKFSPALLVKWKPNFVHPLMHQLPQPTTSNFNRDDKNEHPKKWTIIGNVTEKGFPLKTFVDWLNNGINYAKEVYAKMRESQMTDLEIFRAETRDIFAPEPASNKWTTSQHQCKSDCEVDQLPYMLSPNGKGNLLNYAGENIAGLNSA
ncbi:hypothetical protein GCK72_012462 [Caenorhabditis remanei]|uniref:Uncharacterized protein n=1 Tax=Caenorhabditis remanei TaxID=31234 RepID=A0A6A5GNM9_CAERE|nr:hypothetical protein GCK72_012462 [Caenorhabditis remanei]KAF1756009.1 hypothetical protein GCK72_012462 [Caenorhabditis remanei]